LLPSETQTRALEATLMFSRRTIATVYVVASAIGVALVLWSMSDRSALLTPVDPNLREALIGFGTFIGIGVAFVEQEARLLGFGGTQVPKGALSHSSRWRR
jgi:hypothetical protein